VVSGLEVYPPQIELTRGRDRQSLIGQLQWSHGITQDVSAQLVLELANPAVARIDGQTLYPLADGETVLRVSVAAAPERVVEIPVRVSESSVDPPISFRNDVMPVFSKTGCNTGSCHGAARGKDGFRLSL
jgi:hypothetical protein